MSEDEVVLVGYWNGDTKDWSLSQTHQDDSDQLVILTVEVVPRNKPAVNKDLQRAMKKLPRELRNLVKDLKKWSK